MLFQLNELYSHLFSPLNGLLDLGKRAMLLSLPLPKGFTLPLRAYFPWSSLVIIHGGT